MLGRSAVLLGSTADSRDTGTVVYIQVLGQRSDTPLPDEAACHPSPPSPFKASVADIKPAGQTQHATDRTEAHIRSEEGNSVRQENESAHFQRQSWGNERNSNIGVSNGAFTKWPLEGVLIKSTPLQKAPWSFYQASPMQGLLRRAGF